MAHTKEKVNSERIESFLQGSDPQKYIVSVESYYDKPKVTLVINDVNGAGKYTQEKTYQPFLWFKEDVTSKLYEGKRLKTIEASKRFNVTITKLRTWSEDGFIPERMKNGYIYLAKCKSSSNDLINFFKNGGVDIFKPEHNKSFIMFSPTEQFLIQSGKRLFKGFEDYNDLHRLQFDLETEGLFATKNAIFQIGVKDNKGNEMVIETLGDTPKERRESERQNIISFFNVIAVLEPDIIAGYNSENFDWPFIFERAERLGLPITEVANTLNRASKIKRKPATLKLGGETEAYNQTHMFGYNIIDISHAVRRAMAINSEIKSWGLKYITQYSEIAKPNRVYVQGDKINSTWADKENKYAFNDINGDWYKITETNPIQEGYTVKTGAYIVQRYLIDDLWETEQIDNIFNQASFLISKMLPTTFQRSSTMGTAGQWKLIMSAWSYENGLAIPETQAKRDFTGGLSRLLEVGFARNVYKLDFAALYPKTQLTHGIFPDLDITGVMEGTLTYVVDTRDKYKFLNGKEKGTYKSLEKKLKEESSSMTETEIENLKKEIQEHKALANLYDKKQLPLKILANSWFGSYGAPYIFNWGDTDSAEETTCRGRQYLRLMVKYFTEKHGFRALVLDTDGCNFAAPDNIDAFTYTAKGSHWKTTEDAGVTLSGIHAVLAEFNETYMIGRMGLDLDDVCTSTINFARKNYANDIGGKIKLVGNSIKSKKMPVYIEEFLNKGIRMLLDGDGYSFINHYYDYVDRIYNYKIPLIKMASKSKVKLTKDDYKKKAKMKNKAGNPLPKQAHMELAIRNNLDVTLGDVLYYINIGTSKSQGDLQTTWENKMTKKQLEKWYSANGFENHPPEAKSTLNLNCKLIMPDTVERDFESIKELEMLKKAIDRVTEEGGDTKEFENRIKELEITLFTDEYNVARYLEAFNKKVKPLLVCFDTEIREQILLSIIKVKDAETKKTFEVLKDRSFFTKSQCTLISGKPFKPMDQDSYGDLMIMEDKEIRFWERVNKLPNNMESEDWEVLKLDYHERMLIAKENGLIEETEKIHDIFKRLEAYDLNLIRTKGDLPIEIYILCVLGENGTLVSRKWEESIAHIRDIFTHEKEAIERDKFYKLKKYNDGDNRYELWLDYLEECRIMSGDTITIDTHEVEINDIELLGKLKQKAESIVIEKPVVEKKKKTYSENEEDEEEIIEDENGNILRLDEELLLDDEFDDTFSEVPDGYVIDESEKINSDELVLVNEMDKEAELQIAVEEKEDDWGF
jgi:DNA polymerase elongation subunit (family B)